MNTKMMSKSGTMHHSSLDTKADVREKMAGLCNQQLANTADLYSQTKQAHWNVKGMQFEQLHVLFDKLALTIQPYEDMIAERATALGGTALGTVRMAADASDLEEFPADVFDGHELLELVVDRWATYANSVRNAISQAADAGDPGTEDLFTEISRVADKMLWFAEAHLQS